MIPNLSALTEGKCLPPPFNAPRSRDVDRKKALRGTDGVFWPRGVERDEVLNRFHDKDLDVRADQWAALESRTTVERGTSPQPLPAGSILYHWTDQIPLQLTEGQLLDVDGYVWTSTADTFVYRHHTRVIIQFEQPVDVYIDPVSLSHRIPCDQDSTKAHNDVVIPPSTFEVISVECDPEINRSLAEAVVENLMRSLVRELPDFGFARVIRRVTKVGDVLRIQCGNSEDANSLLLMIQMPNANPNAVSGFETVMVDTLPFVYTDIIREACSKSDIDNSEIKVDLSKIRNSGPVLKWVSLRDLPEQKAVLQTGMRARRADAASALSIPFLRLAVTGMQSNKRGNEEEGADDCVKRSRSVALDGTRPYVGEWLFSDNEEHLSMLSVVAYIANGSAGLVDCIKELMRDGGDKFDDDFFRKETYKVSAGKAAFKTFAESCVERLSIILFFADMQQAQLLLLEADIESYPSKPVFRVQARDACEALAELASDETRNGAAGQEDGGLYNRMMTNFKTYLEYKGTDTDMRIKQVQAWELFDGALRSVICHLVNNLSPIKAYGRLSECAGTNASQLVVWRGWASDRIEWRDVTSLNHLGKSVLSSSRNLEVAYTFADSFISCFILDENVSVIDVELFFGSANKFLICADGECETIIGPGCRFVLVPGETQAEQESNINVFKDEIKPQIEDFEKDCLEDGGDTQKPHIVYYHVHPN